MQPIDTLDYFHAYLRSRLPKDMTVAEFSRKAGISRSQVDGWIKDGIGAPGIDRLDKIAATLGCEVVDLLRPPPTPQLKEPAPEPQKTGPKLVPDSRLTLIGGIVAALTPLNKEKLALVLRFATRLAGGVSQDQDVSDRVQGDK